MNSSALHVNFARTLGKIKPMHGVGQPPFYGMNFSMMHYLTEAHIPYARLHDVGGSYGGSVYVDIPNIFRDFDADETDPASYDFAFTDALMAEIVKAGCEPYYRLGVTIENYPYIRAYRISPPKDFAKWARICEHIVRHYIDGWADGFHYDVTYWEIWNEPDNLGMDPLKNQMWRGTKEQYFDLYRTAATHLKACFGDRIKVGGFASCGFYGVVHNPEERQTDPNRPYYIRFFDDFLDMIRTTNTPIDFFSHHSYNPPELTRQMNRYAVQKLADAGLGDVEIHLNEWHPYPSIENRGSARNCAAAAAMMLIMQDERMDVMCFYDARIGQSCYGGLFNPMTWQPLCTYYAFRAFGALYALGTQAEVTVSGDGLYAVAATDGRTNGVMIANTGAARVLSTDLPAGMHVYAIDPDHRMTEIGLSAPELEIGENQVLYVSSEAVN